MVETDPKGKPPWHRSRRVVEWIVATFSLGTVIAGALVPPIRRVLAYPLPLWTWLFPLALGAGAVWGRDRWRRRRWQEALGLLWDCHWDGWHLDRMNPVCRTPECRKSPLAQQTIARGNVAFVCAACGFAKRFDEGPGNVANEAAATIERRARGEPAEATAAKRRLKMF
jgi:hypothetical protein